MIKKAVDQEPTNGAYLDSLGWVYFLLGRLDEAVVELQKSLVHSGKDPTVNDHLGDVYAKQGNWKAAATQWERSLKIYQSAPGDHEPGDVAKVQKKLEGARTRLAKEKRN